MNKIYLLVLFSFSWFFAGAQTLPDSLKNELLEYFISLPQNNNFHNWIESIENDSSIIIDTAITKELKDSSYFYLRLDSKNFPPKIRGKRRMVIMATNNSSILSKKKIFLLIQMEYYGDTSLNGKLNAENIYNNLSEKLKPYFAYNYEINRNKKGRVYGNNSFFLKKEKLPTLVIQWGKYYEDKSYCLIISLYYQLTKNKK